MICGRFRLVFVAKPVIRSIFFRREAGHQIDLLQQGEDPDDWKPMTTIGSGVREIRSKDASGTFRVIYVAKFARAIFVLHCFQKKSHKTRREDIALAARRYAELVEELGS